ncbi:nudC domain-containing protein 1 [Hylaeus volcanicus]|uniref:nudC domain-containing protein 1 n=1 Tax=Hylaeus volcanicus TaxID=313075 RepID=UPI0023B7A135|nr:nudC domain-containing protein 1 [Hylaeus volcanicus]
MTKIVELRPEKNLINSKFEKYQYSAGKFPITSEIDLKADVMRLSLPSNRDSFLETRLFAFHNHLFMNPHDMSCWFIDRNWIIWQFKYNGTLEQKYSMHDSKENVQNLLYNPSIAFANNDVIAVSDGGDCLKLLIMKTEDHMEAFTLSGGEPGIILDVRCIDTSSTIIIAICNIKSTGEKKFTNLLLLTYDRKNIGSENESFELRSKESLKVKGAVEYVYIEDNGKYLHSICQDYITFECPKVQEFVDNKKDLRKSSERKIPKYCWSQDADSLTVWIKVEKEHQSEVKVRVTPLELSVTMKDNVLIQGQCQHRLDENLTTWKYEQDTCRLELVKQESGLMWSELIKGDTGGECLPNETLAAEIHSRLAHLCTDQADGKLEGQPCVGFNAEQLEECDLEGKDNFLQRINLSTQENTHLAMLGMSNHILLTHKTQTGQAIFLRHDNDGCLWITGEGDDIHWDIKHHYTFPGFGYVQASKSNKMFCVSPADGSYVVILEHMRYIFLYKKPKLDDQIGKQWIVDLGPGTDPIMGAAATNEYLIVLTRNKLYRLYISI